MNALAASACALAGGCTLNAIQTGLQNMQAVKGRLQRCQGIQGITLIDDTYNANPTSLNAALAVLNHNKPPYWLVLGDMKELHFIHHHDLIQSLRTQLPPYVTILIKGSRGMQMEKVVNALRENT